MIPKIFHRVWLGGKPLPTHFLKWGESWQKKHPSWEMKLWTEKEIAGLENADLQEKCSSFAQRSDVARYEILLREGGVYLDTDMECLENIDALIDGKDFFACWQKEGIVSNAIFGGAPNHQVFQDLVTRMRTEFKSAPWNAMGPPFFTGSALKLAHDKIFERKTFIPFTRAEYEAFPQRPMTITWPLPGSFAINHRSSVWHPDSTRDITGEKVVVTEQFPQERKVIESAQYWHYRFNLPWGATVPGKPGWAERVERRKGFFFQRLLDLHGGSLAGKNVLDLGCCQGFWSFESVKAGAASALGVDACPAFIEEAQAVGTVLGINGCLFIQSNLEEDPFWEKVGELREITLFLGILYHLADPAYVLKRAMRLTKETLVIDGEMALGSDPVLQLRPRTMTEPTTVRSGVTSAIRIVPTVAAIVWILKDGGFTDIQVLEPPPHMPADYLVRTTVSIIARRSFGLAIMGRP